MTTASSQRKRDRPTWRGRLLPVNAARTGQTRPVEPLQSAVGAGGLAELIGPDRAHRRGRGGWQCHGDAGAATSSGATIAANRGAVPVARRTRPARRLAGPCPRPARGVARPGRRSAWRPERLAGGVPSRGGCAAGAQRRVAEHELTVLRDKEHGGARLARHQQRGGAAGSIAGL